MVSQFRYSKLKLSDRKQMHLISGDLHFKYYRVNRVSCILGHIQSRELGLIITRKTEMVTYLRIGLRQES
jgi:hypothetical protein